jgi:hypothetical protein
MAGKDQMAKRKQTDADDIEMEQQDAESRRLMAGAAVTETAKKRRKFPVLLVEEMDVLGDNPRGKEAMLRVKDSPDFEDDASALKWAQDKNLSGVFHTITDRGTYRLETETVQKTTIKPVTP